MFFGLVCFRLYDILIKNERGTRITKLGSHFQRLSLCVLNGLEKIIYARDTSKGAGSEARGEGRERGNLPVTTTKPAVAQRAGWILFVLTQF